MEARIFQVSDLVMPFFEKGFVGDEIADADGWEEPVFMPKSEIFRTRIAEITFYEIAVVISIGRPSADALVAVGKGGYDVRTYLVDGIFLLLVDCHGGDCMGAEIPLVIDKPLHVNGTVAVVARCLFQCDLSIDVMGQQYVAVFAGGGIQCV